MASSLDLTRVLNAFLNGDENARRLLIEVLSRVLGVRCENIEFHIVLDEGDTRRIALQADCGIFEISLGHSRCEIRRLPYRVLRAFKVRGFEDVTFYEVEDLVTRISRIVTGREFLLEVTRRLNDVEPRLIRELLREVKSRRLRQVNGHTCKGNNVIVVILENAAFIFMDENAYRRYLDGDEWGTSRDRECLDLVYDASIGGSISYYKGFEWEE